MRKMHELKGNDSVNNKIPRGRSEYAGAKVRVAEFYPDIHAVKLIDITTNTPVQADAEFEEEIKLKKGFKKPRGKVIKTLPAADAPLLEVTNEYVSMRGNGDYGFFSYRESGGNIIRGPLSLATEPHQIKLSGVTRLNPLITSGFPSTIVTPIPTTIWALPSTQMIAPLVRDVTAMATIVAAMGNV